METRQRVDDDRHCIPCEGEPAGNRKRGHQADERMGAEG